jgi:hypothetical protein
LLLVSSLVDVWAATRARAHAVVLVLTRKYVSIWPDEVKRYVLQHYRKQLRVLINCSGHLQDERAASRWGDETFEAVS